MKESKYSPRPNRRSLNAPRIAVLRQDLAIQSYIADLCKPEKPVSRKRLNAIFNNTILVLEYLNADITTHTITDLIQFKKDHPQDTTIEQKLRIYKTLKPSNVHHLAIILGMFRRNFAPLLMHVHVPAGSGKTIPIAEPILRAIRNDSELDERHRNAIDLMAHIGERFTAGNTTPLTDIHLIENTQSAVIDIPANVSKTGTAHPSIIPKELAERMLEYATRMGYQCLLPNYQTIWEQISELAKRKYKVKLTSHYFRKRFQSTAKTIPSNLMPVNNWTILMGEKPKVGHMPQIYDLMTDTELIQQYEQYLAPRLALSDHPTSTKPSELQELRQQNKQLIAKVSDLTETITKLSKLLTEKLTTT